MALDFVPYTQKPFSKAEGGRQNWTLAEWNTYCRPYPRPLTAADYGCVHQPT